MVNIFKVKIGDEIRRFKVESNQFNELENKVRKLFNICIGQNLKLKWQDESNDWITVSSDDELVDALAHKKQEALTLLLLVDGAHSEQHTTTTSSSVNDQPHVGVICDVCETSPVTGIRFKCHQCPNFDLCHTCFLSNHHSEHDMMVIRRPRGRRMGQFGREDCHRGGCKRNISFAASNQPDATNDDKQPSDCLSTSSLPTNEAHSELKNESAKQSGTQKDGDNCHVERERCRRRGFGFNSPVCGRLPLFRHVSLYNPDIAQKYLKAQKATSQDQFKFKQVPKESMPSAPPQNVLQEPQGLYPEVYKVLIPSAPSLNVPQVPQQEASLSSFVHQDLPEHVSKSLKWMQGMGFHNEGGWLSALLLEHNGDINKVMEVMETSSKGDFSSMKA